MPVDGSNPASGIEQAMRLLRQAGFTQGEVLLIGNPADTRARAAAADAQRAGYRVSVLGLGTPAGAAYRTGQGAITHTRLERSEEHTSELPPLMRSTYAVFCLKKKIHE